MSAALPNFDDLWDYNQPDATETRFRALLPLAEASADRSYLAELLTQIARAEGLQRRFAEAHQTLDRAEALLTDAMRRARARYLLERGRVFNSSKRPDQARPLFLAAWEEASAAQEAYHAIDAAHMMAIVEPPEQQLAWNLKALALTEQTTDTHAKKWLSGLYNNIGWTYHDAGKYTQALAYFQKALAVRQTEGDRREIRIARWCVARAQRSLGQTETALATQRELLQEIEQSGENDGYIQEELGECLLALGQAAEAQEHFARAYRALSPDPWFAENEPARLQRLKELGHV
jgi:tetratricopeptide (TPR) repeat protein